MATCLRWAGKRSRKGLQLGDSWDGAHRLPSFRRVELRDFVSPWRAGTEVSLLVKLGCCSREAMGAVRGSCPLLCVGSGWHSAMR